jgi:CheY-like chemotaxis protein
VCDGEAAVQEMTRVYTDIINTNNTSTNTINTNTVNINNRSWKLSNSMNKTKTINTSSNNTTTNTTTEKSNTTTNTNTMLREYTLILMDLNMPKLDGWQVLLLSPTPIADLTPPPLLSNTITVTIQPSSLIRPRRRSESWKSPATCHGRPYPSSP